MRNIIQYALRGFGARIGWVLAGLVLMAVGFDAKAALDCATQEKVTRYSYSGTTTSSGERTATQTACLEDKKPGRFNSPEEALEDALTCLDQQATTAGNRFWKREPGTPVGHVSRVLGTADDWSYRMCRDANLETPVCDFTNQGNLVVKDVCIDAPPGCPEYGTPVENANYFRGVAAVSSAVEVDGQWCEVSGVGGVCVNVPGQGTYCPKWQYTGNPASDPGPGVMSDPRPEINNRVCSADGKHCIGTDVANNCGTYQGEYVCLNSPAAGNCITTPKGNTVCTASPSAPLTTPPAPESPTNPGQVATPAGTVSKPDGSGGIVNNTTTVVFNEGGADTPGGEGTPTGEPDETDTDEGADGEPCGAPDQPVCDVQIDEEGVQDVGTTFDNDLAQARAEAEAAELAALNDLVATVGPEGANNPATGWGIGSLFPSMETGSCQTVSIEFFGGTAKTFPPPILCDFLDGILKPALGYFFALLLTFSVVTGAIRTMSPGAAR